MSSTEKMHDDCVKTGYVVPKDVHYKAAQYISWGLKSRFLTRILEDVFELNQEEDSQRLFQRYLMGDRKVKMKILEVEKF